MAWQTMGNLALGDLVTEADMDAIRGNIEYLLAPNYDQKVMTSGTITTTSTTYAELSAQYAKGTVVTNGGHVEVGFTANMNMNASTSNGIEFDLSVDSVQLGTVIATFTPQALAGWRVNPAFSVFLPGLSAGTHTIALLWRLIAAAGTANIIPNMRFWITE